MASGANYGMMMVDSIMSKDGSEYSKAASDTLKNSLEAIKGASDTQDKSYNSALAASQSFRDLIGSKGQIVKDKDGNVTHMPGSGIIGAIEGEKDFEGRNADLQLQINQNTTDLYNMQYDMQLQKQKTIYDQLAQGNSVENMENVSNTNLALKMNALGLNHLDPSKVKSFIMDPNLLEASKQTGEISGTDYNAIRQLFDGETDRYIKETSQMKLLKAYNENGWLTDKSMLEMAKEQSLDPFNRAKGLDVTDLYTILQDKQRKLRNQGELANHMFDLGYMINSNLMDGNRALGNYMGNTNIQQPQSGGVSSSKRTSINVKNNSNVNNTPSNTGIDENINTDNIFKEDEIPLIDVNSARINDNGKIVVNLNEYGQNAVKKYQETDFYTNKIMQEKYQDDMSIVDSAVDAFWQGAKAALPIAMLGFPYGKVFNVIKGGGKLALNAIGLLASGAPEAVEALSPEVAEQVKSQLDKHNKDVLKMRRDSAEKISFISKMNIPEEEKQKLIQSERNNYVKKVKEYRANIASENMWADEGMRKVLKDKGYDQRLKKAYEKGDLKEIDKINNEVAKDPDIKKQYEKTQKEVVNTKDKSKLSSAKKIIAKTPFGKALKIAGITYGAYEVITTLWGASDYINEQYENDAQRNPDIITTFEDLVNELKYFGSKTPDRQSYIYLEQEQEFNDFISTGVYYDVISKTLHEQAKSGKISQREYSDKMQLVRTLANRADAILEHNKIQEQVERIDKRSKAYQLDNDPLAENANQLQGQETMTQEQRSKYDALVSNSVKNHNSMIPGDLIKENEISYGNAISYSSFTGKIVKDEIELSDGTKIKVSKDKDPIVANFLKTPGLKGGLLSSDKAGAPEGSVPPVTTMMIKSMILNSGIDIHSESGAKMLEDLNQDPEFQSILQDFNKYSKALKSSESESKIYDAVIRFQNLMKEYGEKYMPDSKTGDLTNNRTFAELYSGYDHSNRIFHNQLVTQIKNAPEITKAVREGKIRVDAAMYYITNPNEWKRHKIRNSDKYKD